MKNLFLTGAVGCGKSTSIARALGENLSRAGGFLTVRQRNEEGRAVAYWLKRPDGSGGQVIIDYSAKPYTMHPEVFEDLGIRLLEEAKQADFDQLRIEKVDPFAKAESHDYGTDAAQFIEELMKERNAA